jgi:hypothetical protein
MPIDGSFLPVLDDVRFRHEIAAEVLDPIDAASMVPRHEPTPPSVCPVLPLRRCGHGRSLQLEQQLRKYGGWDRWRRHREQQQRLGAGV